MFIASHNKSFTMKTILVPTDFSETAKNAALYAVNFAQQMKSNRIILFNAYQAPPVVDVNMALVETVDIEQLKKNSEENLEKFIQQLKPLCDGIDLIAISDYGTVALDINEVCAANKADVIVMGVTGAGKLAETLIGSYAVDVSRIAEVPVIIVPPGAVYTAIEEVMLACDFTKVAETTPVHAIMQLLDETGAKLFVVNVDHNNRKFSPDTPFETYMLNTLLKGYNPEYHFLDDPDFVGAINRIAIEKQVDLIITIPKKMGWFDQLFKRSHTTMLAYHSHVPLMVVHE